MLVQKHYAVDATELDQLEVVCQTENCKQTFIIHFEFPKTTEEEENLKGPSSICPYCKQNYVPEFINKREAGSCVAAPITLFESLVLLRKLEARFLIERSSRKFDAAKDGTQL
jgi:hypothetical protein